jgi:flagellin
LLSGTGSITFQVGANETNGKAEETISVKTFELAKTVGTISLGEAKDIEKIETAIAAVSKAAGEFGSVQNRLQYTQSNLAIYSQNLSAAQSSIVDANMAAETTNFTKDQVLEQAGVSVLAQAKSLPQAVLKLLE